MVVKRRLWVLDVGDEIVEDPKCSPSFFTPNSSVPFAFLRAQHCCPSRTISLKPISQHSSPTRFLPFIPYYSFCSTTLPFRDTKLTPCRWEGCWTIVDTRQLLIKEMPTLYYVFSYHLLYHWLLLSCQSSFPSFFSCKFHLWTEQWPTSSQLWNDSWGQKMMKTSLLPATFWKGVFSTSWFHCIYSCLLCHRLIDHKCMGHHLFLNHR